MMYATMICDMSYTSNVHVLFIMLYLLEDTNTASALGLIEQLHNVKLICIGAESVCQNCHRKVCSFAYSHMGTSPFLSLF